MDEIDAALDDINIARFTTLIKAFNEMTQFIIISHNKITMETADVLYGVSMESAGVSQIMSVKFEGEKVSKDKAKGQRPKAEKNNAEGRAPKAEENEGAGEGQKAKGEKDGVEGQTLKAEENGYQNSELKTQIEEQKQDDSVDSGKNDDEGKNG